MKEDNTENRTCDVDGCNRPHLARGCCRKHYDRFRKTGELESKPYSPKVVRPKVARPKVVLSRAARSEIARSKGKYCDIEGCNNTLEARGYCAKHYRQLMYYGDPLFKKACGGKPKLKKSDVIEIKKMIRDSYKNTEIAPKFKISPDAVSDIRTGKTWKQVQI